MSENSVSARAAAWPASRRASGVPRAGAAPSFRRWLQLALAALWLLDAVLQLQSFMFGKGFSQMLARMAAGNPGFIAGPITWSARLVAGHPTWTNAAFRQRAAVPCGGHRLAADRQGGPCGFDSLGPGGLVGRG